MCVNNHDNIESAQPYAFQIDDLSFKMKESA